MKNIHVVDNFLKKIEEFEDVSSINLLKIKKWEKYDSDYERNDGVSEYVLLEDGTEITANDNNNGGEFFTDQNRIVYGPVYDCTQAIEEDYSLYEEEDIIGFVSLGYDFVDCLDI